MFRKAGHLVALNCRGFKELNYAEHTTPESGWFHLEHCQQTARPLKHTHSGYLHRGLASMPKIIGSLFVYGLSFAENDDHVLRMIEVGKIGNLYVSIFGSQEEPHNTEIIARVSKLAAARNARNIGKKRAQGLNVHFFDARSAQVWG